jgi:hypothetical protein
MPDVFAAIAHAPEPLLEMIAHVLELRASMPQQQEMQRTYLREIEFPEGAKVLEVGCGTGAVPGSSPGGLASRRSWEWTPRRI